MSLIQGYLFAAPVSFLYTKIPVSFAKRCSTSLLNFGVCNYSCVIQYPISQSNFGKIKIKCTLLQIHSIPFFGKVEVKYILVQSCSIPFSLYIKFSINSPNYNAEKERQILLFKKLFGARAMQTPSFIKIDKSNLQSIVSSANNTAQSLFLALILNATNLEVNTLAKNLNTKYWKTVFTENDNYSIEQTIFLAIAYVKMQFSNDGDYRRILNYDVPLNVNDLEN